MTSAARTHVDAAIAEWGEALRGAIRREDRGRLTSALFDVQRRQIIGYEAYYELAPDLVRALVASGVTADVASEHMRHALTRPYFLQLFELIVNPLLAREQRLLSGEGSAAAEVAEYDAERLPELAGYVSALVRAYRDDPELGPTAGNDDAQRILGPDDLARCRDALRPAGEQAVRELQRVAGGIALHSVLLHGEHRDGIFDHGPYPGPDGTDILVREINDLANDYLPWSTDQVRLSVSGVAIAYACRGVDFRFDLFGGAATDPPELAPCVEQLGILARRDGELVAIDTAALTGLAAEARAASRALYGAMAEWEPPQRILYGTHLYANHFRPFCLLLDAQTGGSDGAGLVRRFETIGDRIGATLVDRPLPAISGYQADGGDSTAPFFTPVTAH